MPSFPWTIEPYPARARDESHLGGVSFGTKYYVSTFGSDSNPGSVLQPFRTIAKGISVLEAGDILSLRQGVYHGAIDVAGKHGTANNPITIRSYPGEHAYIEASLPEFRSPHNTAWEPAALYDEHAHPEEYVSVTAFRSGVVARGAFVDRDPYTRLITYSRLNDLRADNETFDRLGDDAPRPGPDVVDATGAPLGYRRPWTYMGPGLWFDDITGKVHIRLSHTHNNIPGVTDYAGATDPRQIGLAIAPENMTTLYVRGSSYVRFEDLSIRYGGEHTLLLQANTGLVFDHVQLDAASYGVCMDNNVNTSFCHCQFNGGMPAWYFHSDRTCKYHFIDGDNIVLNELGRQTVCVLLHGGPNDTDTEIAHCEFKDGASLYLAGKRLCFHHSWIANFNGRGMVLDAGLAKQIKIYQNVFSGMRSAFTIASAQVAGSCYIYRNLIDLRGSTAGCRPHSTDDTAVWRSGQLHNADAPDGLHDVFHNTVVVSVQAAQSLFTQVCGTHSVHEQRTYNNLFVVFHSDATTHGALTGSAIDGCGTSGNRAPPQFRRIGAEGAFRQTDDPRLSTASASNGAGVPLPAELHALDPFAPVDGRPHIGCFPAGDGPLLVGIDNRRVFPARLFAE